MLVAIVTNLDINLRDKKLLVTITSKKL